MALVHKLSSTVGVKIITDKDGTTPIIEIDTNFMRVHLIVDDDIQAGILESLLREIREKKANPKGVDEKVRLPRFYSQGRDGKR
jgi:hypothetical protein